MSHDHIAGSSVELIEVVVEVMEFYWIAGSSISQIRTKLKIRSSAFGLG